MLTLPLILYLSAVRPQGDTLASGTSEKPPLGVVEHEGKWSPVFLKERSRVLLSAETRHGALLILNEGRLVSVRHKSGRPIWSIPAEDAATEDLKVTCLRGSKVMTLDVKGNLLKSSLLSRTDVRWAKLSQTPGFVLGYRKSGEFEHRLMLQRISTKQVWDLGLTVDLGNTWDHKILSSTQSSPVLLRETMTSCYEAFYLPGGVAKPVKLPALGVTLCITDARMVNGNLVALLNPQDNSRDKRIWLFDLTRGLELYRSTKADKIAFVRVERQAVVLWRRQNNIWTVFRIRE